MGYANDAANRAAYNAKFDPGSKMAEKSPRAQVLAQVLAQPRPKAIPASALVVPGVTPPYTGPVPGDIIPEPSYGRPIDYAGSVQPGWSPGSDGLFVEAVRTFPEALGTARAFKTSFRLKPEDRLNIWLDEFTARPADFLGAISKLYWGVEREQATQFLERTLASNIVLNADSPAVRRGHVTKDDSLRAEVENALNESEEIAKLYQPITRDNSVTGPEDAAMISKVS